MARTALDALLGRILDNGNELELLGGLNFIGFSITEGDEFWNITSGGGFSGGPLTDVSSLTFSGTAAGTGTIRGANGITFWYASDAGDRRIIEANDQAQSFGSLVGTSSLRFWDAGDGGTHVWRDGNGGARDLMTLSFADGLEVPKVNGHTLLNTQWIDFITTSATDGEFMRRAGGAAGSTTTDTTISSWVAPVNGTITDLKAFILASSTCTFTLTVAGGDSELAFTITSDTSGSDTGAVAVTAGQMIRIRTNSPTIADDIHASFKFAPT